MSDKRFQLILAFGFGVIFVTVLLVLVLKYPNPSATTFFVFRVVLSLASAGIGAVLPGLLVVNVSKRLRAGGALGLFLIVYAFNPPALVVTADSDFVERGELSLMRGDSAWAETYFSEALEKNPRNWRAVSGVARVRFSNGLYREALIEYKRAINLSDGKEWAPYVGLAMCEEALGSIGIQQAVDTLDVALAETPRNTPAENEILFDQGRLLLRVWLDTDAPRDTAAAKKGRDRLNAFLQSRGEPKHWALYHLACFKATLAGGYDQVNGEVTGIRSESESFMMKSIMLLDAYNSPRAEYQKRIMRGLLLEGKLIPGEPVACPALVEMWKKSARRGKYEATFMAGA